MEPPRHPLADITSEVETTTGSQTTNSSPTSQSYPDNSSHGPKSLLPVPQPIKVIVGADPFSQRTWYLPETLLTHHSTLAASLLDSRPDKVLAWPNVDARDFANFVDYMRSSIYSVNTHVPGYSAVKIHTRSCLLGATLGSQDYCNVAIHHLHGLFRPGANSQQSCASKSCLRASDVAFVCAATPSFPAPFYFTPIHGDSLTGLRQLFFDAVASHWTQRDVANTGARDKTPDTVRWWDVCEQNIDFRAALAKTLQTWDGPLRSAYLREAAVYTRFKLKSAVGLTGVEVSREMERGGEDKDQEEQQPGVNKVDSSDDETDAREFIHWEESGPSRPLPPLPSMRRDSSERRTRDRADVDAIDLGGMRRYNDALQSEEAVFEDGEWTVLDEDLLDV